MKRFYGAILFFIAFLSFGSVHAANRIDSLSMDIFINASGDAHVTEVWNCYATKDTEWYHTYKNVGRSEVKNLVVKDEHNDFFETLTNWDVSQDFYGKKNKCGINYINNGFEICFGISEYSAKKTYQVEYDITNFVARLNDSQMAYWTLVDFSQSIKEVYIKIHSDFRYEDTLDVWGFGNYGGTCYVYDGYIEMQPNGSLGRDEYMTILIKFPQDAFDVSKNSYRKNFDEYLEMAQEGSTAYTEDTNVIADIFEIIGDLAPAIVFVVVFTLAFTSGAAIGKITSRKERKEISRYKEYYRDIPCDKNIFKAYYIAYQYNILKKKEDFLGAIFLKWIKEKRMTLQDDSTGKHKNLVLNEIDKEFENKAENRLFIMVEKASKDGILERKELEKWADKNYDSLLNWFKRTIDIMEIEMFGSNVSENMKKAPIDTTALKEEAFKLKGLKNYLTDYTKIDDRGAIEVELFEEYLMYAQIFGIAKKVRKEFEKLYPDMIEQTSIRSYDDLDYIWYMSNRTVTSASSARTAARASSYSSGGGGFSSGGGGGGSFGGGRRRLKIVISLPI